MADFKWGARRLSEEQQRAADEWYEERGASHEARLARQEAALAARPKQIGYCDDDMHQIFSSAEDQERSY